MKKTNLFGLALGLLAALSLAASPVLAQNASVRTTAPTYQNGDSRPLSMTTNAELRVTTGAEVATGASDSVPLTTTANATRAFNYALGSTAWDRLRTVNGVVGGGSGAGILATTAVPVSSSNTGIVGSARTSAGVALTLKATAGNFYEATVVAGASAGFVLVYNLTATPADGAVTPRYCAPVAANQMVVISAGDYPEWFSTGVVVVFSTTGCFTQTLGSAAFIRGRAL